MEIKDTRIYKIREYMIGILDEILLDKDYQLNANFLAEDIDNFSLDKIPVDDNSESWIIPTKVCRDVYEFRSRNFYGADTMNNLSNIGFFEEFEKIIEQKNKEGKFPQIYGVEKIECLNCGALSSVNSADTAEFAVQIQITYLKEV